MTEYRCVPGCLSGRRHCVIQSTPDNKCYPPTCCLYSGKPVGWKEVRDPGVIIDYKRAAKELWMLLDDIDTLTDRVRPEKTLFYEAVYKIISKRHKYKLFKEK